MKLVPDTSVIIDGRITRKVSSGEFKGAMIIVPEAVISELEMQANQGKEIGFNGLEELRKLQDMAREGRISIEYSGSRPTLNQIRMAPGGEIDDMIRSIAVEHDAELVTSDKVQASVARAKGIRILYLKPDVEALAKLDLMDYFTNDTMSVHLKADVVPMAKRGTIGRMRLVQAGPEKLTDKQLLKMAHEILERAKQDPDAFIEIERNGATVVQLGTLRIAIATPPFSDGVEITAVRPVARLSLEDYRFSGTFKDRLIEKRRGILISGPPGAGKSTFAQACADYLFEHDFIVKTMESPRDLQLPEAITQYAPLEGNMENTADILLLVRPDYTIYDELRKTSDFGIFSDMRLSGVGMIGVVHATRGIDAIQRFIGRVELGVIPQVVDTVVFIDHGVIEKVYDIEFTVKVPAGMTESDLARPVINVKDLESGRAEFEVYTFGEQVVVMPIEAEKRPKASWKAAEKDVVREVGKYARGPVMVEMTGERKAIIRVRKKDIPAILGKGGKTIGQIEKAAGVRIDVRATEEEGEEEFVAPAEEGDGIPVSMEEVKKHVILNVGKKHAGQTVEVLAGGDYLFTATVGRSGTIKIPRGSSLMERIVNTRARGEPITARLV
ncbi:MAG TPA: PINc/VapC family ATPase [Methanocella sp.]|nr:PINc/VapC family ATPase [Methanocella sp.]